MCMYTPGCVGRMAPAGFERVGGLLYRIFKCTVCGRTVKRAVAGG